MLLALVTSSLPAQETTEKPRDRELVLQNLAPFPRRELAAVVVPFGPGEVPEGSTPALHAEGRHTAWQPFGARWDDGSLRQALCLFEARLDALAETRLRLVAGAGPKLPTGAVPLPPAQFEFLVWQGDTVHRGTPVRVRDLEHNALRRVELSRCRIGSTGIVAEVLVTSCRGQPHAWIDVALYFSDPTTERMHVQFDEVALESRGLAAVFRHGPRLDVRQRMTDEGSRVVLLNATTLGDGQGVRRTGVLVPGITGDALTDASSKAATLTPVLGATSWRGTHAFGAFGYVPEPPPWLQGSALEFHLADRHQAFARSANTRGGPFDRQPMQQAKDADQTGDQADFGVVRLSLVAHSGVPSLLHEAEVSALQAACRPVHFYEASGEPIDLQAHPEWVVWSGRTHWHAKQSRDRLGKPHPEPKFPTHGWTGKDRQHWSSNTLGAFALLTGAHWARRELEHEITLFLAGQTLDPRFSTSSPGAPRGAGRTLLAASWMYLATGDARLRQRIIDRIEQVHFEQWAGRQNGAGYARPLAVHRPDNRMLRGKSLYWTPWQDALAAVGFGAAFAITGNEKAKELAEEIALNVVRHGFLLTERECEIASALRWQDGRPLTEKEQRDELAAQWSWGSGYEEWAMGALEIARSAATARGDDDLAQRAATIQRRVRAARRRPREGGIDRLTEWDAVRWPPR